MAISLTAFTGAATVQASDILNRVGTIEDYLNGGIVAGDLASGRWVKNTHIERPKFVTSPAPSCHLVSGETHSIHTPHGFRDGVVLYHDIDAGNPLPIPGLYRTVYLPHRDVASGSVYQASIWLSFYAYESGSDKSSNAERDLAATFRMYHDTENSPAASIAGTACYLYGGTSNGPVTGQGHLFSRKLFTMAAHIKFSAATGEFHSFGVRATLTANPSGSSQRNWFKIWTLARTMVVNVEAL